MAPDVHQELAIGKVSPGKDAELSIVIVNWRSVEYLRQCLVSLRLNLREVSSEVIVIDSGSFDGCDRMLSESFPDVYFIQSETNLGFARANNIAFKASKGRSILFLNPDTEVTNGAIQRMLEFLRENPEAGAVGGILLNSDGSVQTSCIQSFPTILNQILDSEFLRRCWPKSYLWGTEPLYSETSRPHPVDAISGACVMLRREVFERAGMFSEEYFMYAEDIDLSYKVARLGYRNYFIPEAVVVHHGGGSSQGAASQFAAIMIREATLRFLAKTRSHSYARCYRAFILLAALVRVGLMLGSSPLELLRGRKDRWKNSLRKWLAVLSWTLWRGPAVSKCRSGRGSQQGALSPSRLFE